MEWVSIMAAEDSLITPLHSAAKSGDVDKVRGLLEHGRHTVDCTDSKGWTPLHYAGANGHLPVVRVLVEHGANVNGGWCYNTPVHVAARCGKDDVALALINEFHCDIKKGSLGFDLLKSACIGGCIGLVRTLVQEHNFRVTSSSAPLHLAAEHGHKELVLGLIHEFGCNPNIQSDTLPYNNTLHLACKGGNVSLVQTLIEKYNADVNYKDVFIQHTALHYAALYGREEVLTLLVDKYGCDTKAKNWKGNSVLHLACGYYGHVEMLTLLVDKYGCDTSAKNWKGDSVLHLACTSGNASLVRTLILKYNADVNARNDSGETPLLTAVAEAKVEVVVALIEECGCDPGFRGHLGRSLLHYAVADYRCNNSLVETISKYVSPLVVDDNGDTPLHVACSELFYESGVRALLKLHPPILVRNNLGKTPRDVADPSNKLILDEYKRENRDKIYTHYNAIQKSAQKKYSTAERITRIFVIGNPGAGKSSLVETLKRERFLESFQRVSESSVPPHTAGIVPSIHTSKHYGRVLFYDFAGDPEYYSSHAAILENLASSSKGDNIFIIVVDLRKDWIKTMKIVHYWLSFVQHQKFSKIESSLIIVGSHSDQIPNDVVQQRNVGLQKLCDEVKPGYGISHKVEAFILDCRNPKSKHVSKIQSQIANLTRNSPRHSLSSPASILLGLLEKDFRNEPAFPVAELKSHIEATGISLPTDLHYVLNELHEIGLLFLVGTNKDQLHVVFNISKLTNEVHRLLFSLHSETSISSFNIGIIPQSILQEILPENITKECLIQLQYCQEISHRDVGAFPSLPQSDSSHQSFLFFPALCSVDKSDVSWITPPDLSYSIGWLARCTDPHDYFPPRFLHVLLLRLVFGFTLSAPCVTDSASPDHSQFQRRCTMWKTGVHWMMKEGVECMVELVNDSKGVVVLTKSDDDAVENCVSVFNRIISCVMEAGAEFCHSIRPQSFLLDSTHEADYLNEDHLFALGEVEEALTSSQGEQVVVSVSGKGRLKKTKILCLRKLTLWYSLFPMDYISVLHLLEDIVRGLYKLGLYLNIPQGVLEAIEKDFPTDTGRQRRELVRAWLSSSLEPPCWWRLVQALRSIKESAMAEGIDKEHGVSIRLQEKLLASQYRDLKLDQEFLESFAGLVGPKWPSLAATLSLSVDQGKGEGLTQQDHTLHMLKGWSLREGATYGQLCHKLQTISLFQY